jgi:hypothetical protein
MKINHSYAAHVTEELTHQLETAVENLEAARRKLDELVYNDDHDVPAEVMGTYLADSAIVPLLWRVGVQLRAMNSNWLVDEHLPKVRPVAA